MLSHPLEDAVLDSMFFVHSYNTWHEIRTISGEDFFASTRNVLFPSTLVSIFLFSAMGLLQSPLGLEIIVIKVVQLEYRADNKLKFCGLVMPW